MNNPHDSAAEEKRLGILAGLEDVLAGRTVPDSQVKEWAAEVWTAEVSGQEGANPD